MTGTARNCTWPRTQSPRSSQRRRPRPRCPPPSLKTVIFLRLDVPPPPRCYVEGGAGWNKTEIKQKHDSLLFPPRLRPARWKRPGSTLPVWEPHPREWAGPFANPGAVAVETAGAGLSAARTSGALRRRPAGGLVPGWSWSGWSGRCPCCRCGMCGGVRTPISRIKPLILYPRARRAHHLGVGWDPRAPHFHRTLL